MSAKRLSLGMISMVWVFCAGAQTAPAPAAGGEKLLTTAERSALTAELRQLKGQVIEARQKASQTPEARAAQAAVDAAEQEHYRVVEAQLRALPGAEEMLRRMAEVAALLRYDLPVEQEKRTKRLPRPELDHLPAPVTE